MYYSSNIQQTNSVLAVSGSPEDLSPDFRSEVTDLHSPASVSESSHDIASFVTSPHSQALGKVKSYSIRLLLSKKFSLYPTILVITESDILPNKVTTMLLNRESHVSDRSVCSGGTTRITINLDIINLNIQMRSSSHNCINLY